MEALREEMIAKLETVVGNKEDATIIENDVYKFYENWCNNNQHLNNLKAGCYKKLYIAKVRQVYHTLKQDSYIKFGNPKVLSNTKAFSKIAHMSYKDLCPMKWKLYSKDLEILEKEIADFDKNVQTTDTFTCPKCKQNKCVYSEVQTRSCDESATIFVRCMTCGNAFKG